MAPIFKEASVTLTKQPFPKAIVSIKDRIINFEAFVAGTLADHALPFTAK